MNGKQINGKQIVVTGASSGIGAALAKQLATDGHRVYACARRTERLHALTRQHPNILSHPCDVSEEAQVQAFVQWIRTRTASIDALVNGASGFGEIGPAIQTDSRAWLKTLEVNLFGTYLMIKHVTPLMVRECGPRIVNFSGGGAFAPFPNYSAYGVSKAAVVRLTETLAVELAPRGIAVNAVAPGFVATEIHEETLRQGPERAGREHFERTQRLLQEGAAPIERALACIQFLLSDQAAGLTGKTISASFDPWGTPTFAEWIPQINQSDLYTMRRVNLAHATQATEATDTADADLRQALSRAAARQQEAIPRADRRSCEMTVRRPSPPR